MLPNFLILGAAKSATTWLVRELGRHPEVYAHPAEIHYFSRHAEKPIAWYESHFASAANARAVGENSNTYLYAEEAPRRIVASLSEARLIAVLRHPVERAYSGYCMQLANGQVSRHLASYLDPEKVTPDSAPDFLGQGLYARHLERYLRIFDRSRLKILLYDDLVGDSTGFLREVLGFLRVDPEAMPPPGERRNVRRKRDYPRPLRPVAAWLDSRFSTALQRISEHPAGSRIRDWLRSRPVEYPPLTDELRRKLAAYYARDVERLEVLIGRDLARWRG